LKSQKADEEGKEDISWNFAKFLVDGAGNVLARYAPKATPEEIAKDLPGHL
jgi:glutathione peroxidase